MHQVVSTANLQLLVPLIPADPCSAAWLSHCHRDENILSQHTSTLAVRTGAVDDHPGICAHAAGGLLASW
jgi:hypothetical protein